MPHAPIQAAAAAAAEEVAAAAPSKPKSGKAGAAARNAAALAAAAPVAAKAVAALAGAETGVSPASLAQLTHVPTAIERAADPAHLKIIRDIYGSRAQTIINTLLSFDAYFNWYYPLKYNSMSVLDTDKEKLLDCAFTNCTTAIDMHEIVERLSIRYHKSFLFHGAIFKVTRDILRVGDAWMFGTSSLELQNAETKRTAKLNGSKRLEISGPGLTRIGMAPGFAGPSRLAPTAGYNGTMALSTLNFLLVRGVLRRGGALIATPDSRRAERLFGVFGNGRMCLPAAGMKLEMLGADYDPKWTLALRLLFGLWRVLPTIIF